MPFSNGAYTPEQIKLMAGVLDAAWDERPSTDGSDLQRLAMARRIMAAVDGGERDPDKLKLAALGR